MQAVHVRGYEGEVDLFLVYCPGTQKVYVIAIEDATKTKGSLRVAPTANNQVCGVRWAHDYELPA
jgi:hypothetical protein